MSFAATTAQMRSRSKRVTRRLAWRWVRLKPGDLLLAVEKCQGLKKGERQVVLGPIRVVSVRQERLDDLVDPARPSYGAIEMTLEGFPGRDPHSFVLWFSAANDVDPDGLVTRIEFEHVLRPAA